MHPTPLNHPKHIRHILDQDACGFGDGIDVLFTVIRHVGTGHQVQIFEGCVEAFTDAGVEIAEGASLSMSRTGDSVAVWDMGVKRWGGLFIVIRFDSI